MESTFVIAWRSKCEPGARHEKSQHSDTGQPLANGTDASAEDSKETSHRRDAEVVLI
jgi:hypothetical protein